MMAKLGTVGVMIRRPLGRPELAPHRPNRAHAQGLPEVITIVESGTLAHVKPNAMQDVDEGLADT